MFILLGKFQSLTLTYRTEIYVIVLINENGWRFSLMDACNSALYLSGPVVKKKCLVLKTFQMCYLERKVSSRKQIVPKERRKETSGKFMLVAFLC